MGRIEIEVTKFIAGLGYDAYSARFPEGGTINFRISKSVLRDPKPKKIKVTLEWDDGG